MMLEYSTGELIARAAFMHHDDQRHDALRHYAILKGFIHNNIHYALLSQRYTMHCNPGELLARATFMHHETDTIKA